MDVVDFARRRRGLSIAAPALAAALAVGGLGSVALAQDATPEGGVLPEGLVSPPRPAHIHEGSCGEEELGGIVAPLNDLTASSGAILGNAEATLAETSFTNVPLPLDAILAADHAINVHFSADEIEEYIACGEIGGALNANGALVIGLEELNRSGFTGIAFLAPGADGASTDVSVFVAEGLAERGRGGQAAQEATPGAVGGVADEDDAAEDGQTLTNEEGGMATAAADIDDALEADETATAEADLTDDADETATAEADATAETDADAAGDDGLLDEEGALGTGEIDGTPTTGADADAGTDTAEDAAGGIDAAETPEIDIDATAEADEDEA